MVKPTAAHPRRRASSGTGGDGGNRVGFAVQGFVVVALQNQRQATRIFGGSGFEEAQGSGIGVAAGVDGKLEMIPGIVPGGIGGEAPGRTMLETLVHGQNNHFSGAFQGGRCTAYGTDWRGCRGCRSCTSSKFRVLFYSSFPP